jgi:hypothetical protein
MPYAINKRNFVRRHIADIFYRGIQHKVLLVNLGKGAYD